MSPTKETLLAWQNRPQKLVAKFIKQSLANETGFHNGNNSVTKNAKRSPPSSLTNEKMEGTLSSDGRAIPALITTSSSFSRHRQSSSRSNSESSTAEIDSYEDELNASKKFTGKGDRVRIDSMSQITGVRFDAD